MRIDDFLDARQSRTSMVQGSRVNLFEGHQQLVGVPTRTTVDQKGLYLGQVKTASAVSQEQVFVTRSAHRGGCELECVLVAKEQCDEQPVYLSVKEAEFPQRNSVNPNILRLEANRVCTYISATEGRGD